MQKFHRVCFPVRPGANDRCDADEAGARIIADTSTPQTNRRGVQGTERTVGDANPRRAPFLRQNLGQERALSSARTDRPPLKGRPDPIGQVRRMIGASQNEERAACLYELLVWLKAIYCAQECGEVWCRIPCQSVARKSRSGQSCGERVQVTPVRGVTFSMAWPTERQGAGPSESPADPIICAVVLW